MTLTSGYLCLDHNNDRHVDVNWLIHLHQHSPHSEDPTEHNHEPLPHSSRSERVCAPGRDLAGWDSNSLLNLGWNRGMHRKSNLAGRHTMQGDWNQPNAWSQHSAYGLFLFLPLKNPGETQWAQTKPPHKLSGIVESCARAGGLPAASLATVTRWRDASEPARCSCDPDDTFCKTTQPGLRHASSYLPKLGHRGQRVGDLRNTAQVSATGHSAPCAGRRHDSCQLNEADWNGSDVRDSAETDAILDLRGDACPLADRTSQTQNGTVRTSVTVFDLIIAITRLPGLHE